MKHVLVFFKPIPGVKILTFGSSFPPSKTTNYFIGIADLEAQLKLVCLEICRHFIRTCHLKKSVDISRQLNVSGNLPLKSILLCRNMS